MPKPKRKSGLQKDFSKIFDGVWVPEKPHIEQTPETPSPPTQQESQPPASPPSDQQQTEQIPLIEQIGQIMRSMECAKGFECFKSGFQTLCKVENVGDGDVIECSPENLGFCEYRFEFMDKTLCKCQLRHFIAKNLGR